MPAGPVEIVIRGHLGPAMTTALHDFVLIPDAGSTRMVGEVADQAALLGLLELLDELHVEVVSVNPVTPAAGSER
jgi:hypothetical protein